MHLDDNPVFAIHRVARVLRSNLSRHFADADITPEQWFLLQRIDGREGCSQKELADGVLQDHANITRLLDRLAAAGYVERRPSPTDRRRFDIYLTHYGKRQLRGSLVRMQEEHARIFAGIKPREIALLKDVLERMEKNVGAS